MASRVETEVHNYTVMHETLLSGDLRIQAHTHTYGWHGRSGVMVSLSGVDC